VIRRGFWLTAGAVTGIVAYRRASAVGRQISGRLNLGPSLDAASSRAAPASRAGRAAGTGVGPPKPLISVRRTRRAAIRAARETYRFTRDVREGMDLYMARHSDPAGSTLRTSQDAPPQALEAPRREGVPLEPLPFEALPFEALPFEPGSAPAARHDDTKDGH
jgi:hypothetical protein